ncbi:head decoration [Gordonia phage GMA4]|uniref:head decoration n=1 Tax=Gordonia phage GMA4 TaxID=1647471 RepID=UPI0006BD120D|nr:head decoration [Gordonia phage GMA4]AKJ72341.1 putative structural protein [Gordonia phage GMA4]
MAIPFVNDIDLRGNEIQDFRVPRLNGLPTATAAQNGYVVYNTQDDRFYVCRSAAWMQLPQNLTSLEGTTKASLLDRTNHTGSQSSSTISDFHAAVIASRLDEFAAPTTAVSMGTQRITNLATGTGAADAVTKAQLDAVAAVANAAASGIAIKNAVRAVAKTNITLTGAQTIDGVAVVAGDRVLVAGQTSAAANGIYLAAAGAWSRTTDADETGELAPGTLVAVREGTTEADTLWGLVSDAAITVGTTNQTWTRMVAGSTGEIITAGNGLTKTGNTLSVLPKASGGITVDGTGIAVDSTIARTASGTVPAGSTNATITHNLGTDSAQITIWEASTGKQVMVEIAKSGANAVVATFKTAPTVGQYSFSARS